MGLRSRARFSDMQLPPNLRQALAQATAQVPLAALSDAAQDLSQRYRAQTSSTASIFPSDVHRLAYATVRMPATFAAVRAVLAEMTRLMPAQQIESVLDLGAGPGEAGPAGQLGGHLDDYLWIHRWAGVDDQGVGVVGAHPALPGRGPSTGPLRAGCSAIPIANSAYLERPGIMKLFRFGGNRSRPVVRLSPPTVCWVNGKENSFLGA